MPDSSRIRNQHTGTLGCSHIALFLNIVLAHLFNNNDLFLSEIYLQLGRVELDDRITFSIPIWPPDTSKFNVRAFLHGLGSPSKQCYDQTSGLFPD